MTSKPLSMCVSVLAVAIAAASLQASTLIVGDMANNAILKYDAATGASIGSFVLAAGQNSPMDIALSPDQSVLYVQTSTGIEKYNPLSGAYLGQLTPNARESMTVGPNGSVYVGDRNQIYQVTPDGVETLWKQLGNYAGDPLTCVGISRDGQYVLSYVTPTGPDKVTRTLINADGSAGDETNYHTTWTNTNYASGMVETVDRFFINQASTLKTTVIDSGAIGNSGYVVDTTVANPGSMLAIGPDSCVYYVGLGGKSINRVDSYTATEAVVSTFLTDENLGTAFGLAFLINITPALHPGDANGDNTVDLQDFGLLKDHFGMTEGALWSQGDFNKDGTIDLQDFGILKDHFGHSAGDSPVTAVPEPATLSLLVLAAAAGLRRRRR